MSSVPERSDIDTAHTWDLESIYETDEAWEADVERARDLVETVASYEGRVGESPETLVALLEYDEQLSRTVETVMSYAYMRRDEDTRRDTYQAMYSTARSLSAEAESASSFLEPELQQLDPETLQSWLDSEPDLREYDHYFDDIIRRRDHTREAEIEEVLADLSDVLGAVGDIYTMFHNADLEFPTVEDPEGEPIEITQSNFTTLLQDPDRAFRESVYTAYYDTWEEYRNTVATTYQHLLKREDTMAGIRGFDTTREMNLFGPNVPLEVYDTLVSSIRDNLDALHRHVDMKATALGVDELAMWDLYAPMAASDEPTIPYEEATEHVIEAFAVLGEDYQSRVADGIESRWIDVYESKGKRGGAYSGGTYDTQPFILMNYQDDLSSMYTLAHELGHSLHSEYTRESQPYIYANYATFIAEVASTVNEILLTEHLLETIDDAAFRRHILDKSLERYRSVLYRQTLFAEFERDAHALVEGGEPVTADRLDDLFAELKGAYYAPADVDERIAREWMRIPHFYRPFYVFQYSTGISAAVAIARDILDRGEPAAERYLDFLRLGSSKYPIDLLEAAGVDMTSAAPIESAIDGYHERLDAFESTR